LKANPAGAARVVHVTCAASKSSTASANAVTTAAAAPRCHPGAAYANAKKFLERHSVVFSSRFVLGFGVKGLPFRI
jgi:hypothetical protein